MCNTYANSVLEIRQQPKDNYSVEEHYCNCVSLEYFNLSNVSPNLVPEAFQNMRVPYLNRYSQMYFNPLAYASKF